VNGDPRPAASFFSDLWNDAGVDAGKVWNYAPDDNHPLEVPTPNDPQGFVQWGYHVAPTVPVVVDGVTTPATPRSPGHSTCIARVGRPIGRANDDAASPARCIPSHAWNAPDEFPPGH
jgi:hypothetical protein